MLLVYLLIIIFLILIGYSLFFSSQIEGMENESQGTETQSTNKTQATEEYQAYNTDSPNNCLILAQQNAGNIEVLKGRVDGLDEVKKTVDTMKTNLELMQTQMDGLVQQQADYAAEIAGGTEPLEITGTMTEDIENS